MKEKIEGRQGTEKMFIASDYITDKVHRMPERTT